MIFTCKGISVLFTVKDVLIWSFLSSLPNDRFCLLWALNRARQYSHFFNQFNIINHFMWGILDVQYSLLGFSLQIHQLNLYSFVNKKVKAGGETGERCNKTKKDLAIVGLGTTTDFLETQEGLRTGLSTSVRKKTGKKNPHM